MHKVRAVLFDAVGTLIHPDPPVADVYRAIGLQHGSRLSLAEIEQRFYESFSSRDAYGSGERRWVTSELDERRWWQQIVRHVFSDVTDTRNLFDELWQHFAESRNWRIFDDVSPVFDWLRRQKIEVGIASNFDDRLIGICERIHPLSDVRHVFHSSELGVRKPHLSFFQEVQNRLKLRAQELMLVGDDPHADVAGARLAGWGVVHLQRGSKKPPSASRVSGLIELIDLLANRRNDE